MFLFTKSSKKNNNILIIYRSSTFLQFLSVCILCVLLLLAPLPEGLDEKGRNTLVLVLFAVILWAKELLPPPLTALLLMTLFPLFNVLTYQESITGLGHSSIWLLIGVFIIACAMQETGLDQRIALHLLKLAKGNARITLLLIIVTTTLFIFLIPTASGRVAIMVPICLGMVKAMQLEPGSNIGKFVFISISFSSFIGSIGLMTGAISMVYAAGIFESLLNYSWSYLSWLKALMPSIILINFFIWLLFLKLFPPEIDTVPGGLDFINSKLITLDKISKNEIKIFLLIILMITFWILEDYIHLSVSQTCLFIAVLTMLPGIEIITWKKALASIDWGVILLLGTSIAIVQALTSSNAIEWISHTIFYYLQGLNPLFLGVMTMLLMGVIRFGFPNLLSMVATTMPMIITLAFSLKINPVWFGLIGISSSVLGVFLPTQSVAHLTSYNTGYYSIKDMLRAGFYTSLIIIIVTTVLANYYWPLLGISP
ncbi:MAG: SLC13 family permease [Peptococcaceae bacterium]